MSLTHHPSGEVRVRVKVKIQLKVPQNGSLKEARM
jgi:hypothetical protein